MRSVRKHLLILINSLSFVINNPKPVTYSYLNLYFQLEEEIIILSKSRPIICNERLVLVFEMSIIFVMLL